MRSLAAQVRKAMALHEVSVEDQVGIFPEYARPQRWLRQHHFGQAAGLEEVIERRRSSRLGGDRIGLGPESAKAQILGK